MATHGLEAIRNLGKYRLGKKLNENELTLVVEYSTIGDISEEQSTRH